MTLRVWLFVWVAAGIAAGFLWAPVVPVLEDTTRVFYFHFPAAIITPVALAWSMLHSALYLWRRDLANDDHAAAAAELGLLFCVAATVSGSIWAHSMWGSYWNWDPRETSIFFVLLLYGAYLALRASIEDPARRARLSAVYSCVAFVPGLFLIFVVPRIYFSLHPDPLLNSRGKADMDGRIMACAVALVLGFGALFFWMLSLRVRLGRVERARESVAS
ncbi:MAG: cytochrome c biogenesis protein CcsA [Candidatus Eisenbacteria bacterium]|nr:cytochrome c biogenesis protein CcsA [Candidatus Eisenbacteria bacterium]